MLTNILYLVVLLSGSLFCAVKLNQRFEDTIAVSCMLQIVILFAFGLCGILIAGCVVIGILSVVCIVWSCVELVRKRNWNQLKEKFLFTPGFLLFVVSFLGLMLLNNNRLSSFFDEYSHWMDIINVMVTLDDFGTHPLSGSMFASYPPGLALFAYFFQKLRSFVSPDVTFTEWRVYLSCQILYLSAFFPLVKSICVQKPMNMLALCAILYIGPLAFYNYYYSAAYADQAISMFSGAGLALVILKDNMNWPYHLQVWLTCAVLVLTKDVGLLFALFLAIAYAGDYMIWLKDSSCVVERDGQRAKKTDFVRIIIPFLIILSVKVLWALEVQNSGKTVIFSGKIDFHNLLQVLSGQDDSYRRETAIRFWNAFSEYYMTLGNLGTRFTFFSLLIVYAAVSYLLWHAAKKAGLSYKTWKLVLILQLFQCVVYTIGMGLAYMYKFSEVEALMLASFQRYLCMVFLSGWMLLLLSGVHLLERIMTDAAISETLILMLLVITMPSKGIYKIVQGDKEEAYVSRKPHREVCSAMLDFCDSSDSVLILAADSKLQDEVALRYEWRISSLEVPSFEWINMANLQTQEEHQSFQTMCIEKYDYVAIFDTDATLIDGVVPLFEEGTEILAGEVYKVNPKNGILSHCNEIK